MELVGELYRCEGSRFGPPFNDDAPATSIDADDHRTGIGYRGGLDEMRIFNGRRCDDDPACASFHPTMHLFHRPDSTTDLHLTAARGDNLVDDGRVLAVIEHCIEIDHMQPLGALCHQIAGSLYRIEVINERAIDPVANQIDKATFPQFEIGIDDHCRSLSSAIILLRNVLD